MTIERKKSLVLALIIAAVALAAYANTLNHGFVWDDKTVIVANPIFDHVGNIPRFFLLEDHADVKTGYYRPITYISFTLERAVWGMNPVGLDIDNLLLHALVAVLFFRVVVLLFHRNDLAFVAALLFALHPIAGETVNFHAGGRNTLLCACFVLLSLQSYLKRKIPAATAWFLLGIFSKEFALLLPLLFILYDRLVAGAKPRVVSYLPFLASVALYLVLRSYAVQAHANLLTSLQLSGHLVFVPSIIVTYLTNLVFPFHLKSVYFFDTQHSSDLRMVFVDSVIVAALIAGAVWSRRRELLFSLSLFLLFLLPVLNLIPLGSIVIADRYAYFSAFGFCLAVSYLICQTGTKVRVPLAVGLCAVYIGIVVMRNGYWKDDISFCSKVIEDAPSHSLGYQNLGYDLYEVGDFTRAQKYLEMANEKTDQVPGYLVPNADLFLEMNQPRKALASLEKKLALQPDDAEALFMAGKIYEQLGDAVNARRYLQEATRLQPAIADSMKKEALYSCQEGEEALARRVFPPEQRRLTAERSFKKALRIDPASVPALVDLGNLYGESGRIDEAIRYFQTAAGIEPSNPVPLTNLAVAYQLEGKTAEYNRIMEKVRALGAAGPVRGK